MNVLMYDILGDFFVDKFSFQLRKKDSLLHSYNPV